MKVCVERMFGWMGGVKNNQISTQGTTVRVPCETKRQTTFALVLDTKKALI